MDCGLKMQLSYLKRKHNIVPGAQGDTHEVGGRYLNFRRDSYLDTTNVKYTLSCPWPGKIVANGVCLLGTESRLDCSWEFRSIAAQGWRNCTLFSIASQSWVNYWDYWVQYLSLKLHLNFNIKVKYCTISIGPVYFFVSWRRTEDALGLDRQP